MIFIVYISLTRTPAEGLLFVVASCYAIGLLSVMLTSLTVFTGLCVFYLFKFFELECTPLAPFTLHGPPLGSLWLSPDLLAHITL